MQQELGYVTPVRAFLKDGRIYTHVASGCLAEGLAQHFQKVHLCVRVGDADTLTATDRPLESTNIDVVPQPFWGSTLGSLRHVFGIGRAYWRTCRKSDQILIRGMCPYVGLLYLMAFLLRRRVCHWVVGDPVALLRTSSRHATIVNVLSLAYAVQDRWMSRFGRWLTNGTFICNGHQLAGAYRSRKTIAAVSSTVRDCDFFPRADTCQTPAVRILFAGYIRPEKGLEFLLDAVSLLSQDLPWALHIVGPDEFPLYRRRLDGIVAARGIGGRVHWEGYVSYGTPMYERMREADVLVLPTLSEGTPHVLAEARANGLPCISTLVGGIPSAVTNGVDALLVPAKDAAALASAIERIAFDGELRRMLILNGLASARQQTAERFLELVLRELQGRDGVRAVQAAAG